MIRLCFHLCCEKGSKVIIISLLFIRRSLVACLLIYGCDRDGLVILDMVKEEEIKDLPSRSRFCFCKFFDPYST